MDPGQWLSPLRPGLDDRAVRELAGTALQTNDGMNYGMAIGREVKPGLRQLYFGTLDGKIIVATPQ